jgi:hypothetical protein
MLGLSAAPAAARTPQAPQRLSQEVMALRRLAEATHPRGAEARLSPQWAAACQGLAARADRLPLSVYLVELRRLLTWFADGHTTILPFEFVGEIPPRFRGGGFDRHLPLRARAFHDGMWIIEAKGPAAPLLGGRIEAVNGVPITKVMQAHAAAWPCESPAWAHNWAGLLFSSVGLLEGLGFARAGEPVTLAVAAPGGAPRSLSLTPTSDGDKERSPLQRPASPMERYAKETGRGNFVRAEGEAVLVSIDEMADVDGFSFDDMLEALGPHLAGGPARRLIIDLRRNGGGDNYLGEALRREIARSRFDRPGGLYVLTGPQTFSAGQNLANRLERETFALMVGAPTGSAPNLHGDPKVQPCPVSGATAMIATLTWQDGGPHDRRPCIYPDLPAPELFADWAAGRDRALELAVSHEDNAPDDFRSRTRYFERPSQAQGWRPFWRA